jgi:hypothetical protein
MHLVGVRAAGGHVQARRQVAAAARSSSGAEAKTTGCPAAPHRPSLAGLRKAKGGRAPGGDLVEVERYAGTAEPKVAQGWPK